MDIYSPEIKIALQIAHKPKVVPVHRVQVGVFRCRQVHFKRFAWFLRHNGHYLQPKPVHVPAAHDGALSETHVQSATVAAAVSVSVVTVVVIHGVISHGGYIQPATTDEAGVPAGAAS